MSVPPSCFRALESCARRLISAPRIATGKVLDRAKAPPPPRGKGLSGVVWAGRAHLGFRSPGWALDDELGWVLPDQGQDGVMVLAQMSIVELGRQGCYEKPSARQIVGVDLAAGQ